MPVDPAEPVARFLLDRRNYNAQQGRVKHRPFLPPPDLKTSVFRVADLSEPAIWQLGRHYVAEPRGRSLVGRAQLRVEQVREVGLEVEEEEPPERHANIVRWPDNKDERLAVAHELADRATLILTPTE